MKYIQGEAFKTLDEVAKWVADGQPFRLDDVYVPAEHIQLSSLDALIRDLQRGALCRAVPEPDPVRCPCCHETMEWRPGPDLHTCQRCCCSFLASRVRPCPDCAQANAERDEFRRRCDDAERYLRTKLDLSYRDVNAVLSILLGEGRG